MSAVLSQETDYSSCNAHNNGDDNSINNTIDANNSTQLTFNNFAYPTNSQVRMNKICTTDQYDWVRWV